MGQKFKEKLLGFTPSDTVFVSFAEVGNFVLGGQALIDGKEGAGVRVFGFSGQEGIGFDFHDQFAQGLGVDKQWDGVLVTFAHLAAV